MKRSQNEHLRALCEGAIMVALAQVLSFLKLWELPQGGAVTVGMLPIFLYCARWGFGAGMLASSAYAVLQVVLDGAFAWSWQSIVGDYLLAFAVLGLAGLFSRRRGAFFYGTVLGCAARFLVHWVVGATIWAEFMPERFFGMTMTSPWLYSALYQTAYMVPNTALCLLVFALLSRYMKKYLTGKDLR